MGMSPHRKCWRHKRTLGDSREQTKGIYGDEVRTVVTSERVLAQSIGEPSGELAWVSLPGGICMYTIM